LLAAQEQWRVGLQQQGWQLQVVAGSWLVLLAAPLVGSPVV
jgi:hypothetical protein